MNKIFTITAILILTFSLQALGQSEHPEKFEYSEMGINDYVVTSVGDVKADEIYNKTVNYIKETFKNPERVIEMKIENEKVRINGIAPDLLIIKERHSFNLDYVIEISIKDGRYKFEINKLRELEQGTDYMNIPNFKTDKKITKNFGKSPERIESFFNNLNQGLKLYITNSDEEDDW